MNCEQGPNGQHQAFELLGREVQDRVSEHQGIVDSICFDLYGCVQASFAPKVNDKGERLPGHWYDIKRLKVINPIPCMPVPNFSHPEIGAADKPTKEEGVFA